MHSLFLFLCIYFFWFYLYDNSVEQLHDVMLTCQEHVFKLSFTVRDDCYNISFRNQKLPNFYVLIYFNNPSKKGWDFSPLKCINSVTTHVLHNKECFHISNWMIRQQQHVNNNATSMEMCAIKIYIFCRWNDVHTTPIMEV